MKWSLAHRARGKRRLVAWTEVRDRQGHIARPCWRMVITCPSSGGERRPAPSTKIYPIHRGGHSRYRSQDVHMWQPKPAASEQVQALPWLIRNKAGAGWFGNGVDLGRRRRWGRGYGVVACGCTIDLECWLISRTGPDPFGLGLIAQTGPFGPFSENNRWCDVHLPPDGFRVSWKRPRYYES
jgi:hypothetical protein